MNILVDADACPVKKNIIHIAKTYNIEVIMFFDTAHIYNDGYSQVIILDQGRDSVDFALIGRLKKGDIVVTQDYGVATMALSKGAKALNQNGLIYTDDNIDTLLYQRHISSKLRRSGIKTKGPKKRTPSQNNDFEKSLRQLILEKNSL
jgi:hypothetical protein